MKDPTLLELEIMRELSKKNCSISDIMKALALADPGIKDIKISYTKALPTRWSKLSRNTIWNRVNALIENGLVYKETVKYSATARDNYKYGLTEFGRLCLVIWESRASRQKITHCATSA